MTALEHRKHIAICEEVGVPHRFIKLLVHTARGWMVRGFTSFFSASCPSPDSYARPTQYNAMISLLILSLNPKIRSNLFTTQWDRRDCRQYREPSHTGCLNAMLIWSSTYREAYIIQRVWTEAEAAQWYIVGLSQWDSRTKCCCCTTLSEGRVFLDKG